MKSHCEERSYAGALASSWLQRHGGSAVTLDLEWKQTGAVSWVMAHDAQPLSALKRLRIIVEVGTPNLLPHLHLQQLM